MIKIYLRLVIFKSVGDCFTFSFTDTHATGQNVTPFVDYLILSYIEDDAKFPLSMWANTDASLGKKTNACESFQAHFNK